MICFPSFLIIRGRTGNTEYFRVRIPDIGGFLDLLPGNKFIHHCNDGLDGQGTGREKRMRFAFETRPFVADQNNIVSVFVVRATH